MNIYNIWCSLKPGVQDKDFVEAVDTYMARLKQQGLLETHRLMRRKLGLGPAAMLEFHLMLEFKTLAQLDQAFNQVSSRSDPIESFHHAVNGKVKEVVFALYRDFPDEQRVYGQEKF
ncbi:MAG: DUF6614 family protein [Arenicellales bacterium WSBS_2016_MAG_OTU3]